MAQTQKEILRDTILTKMKPFLDAAMLDILNQVMVSALFCVDVVESETLPATRENTNEYIIDVWMLKKAPKLSKDTVKYYLDTIKHFVEFVNKSLLDVTDMDVECYLQWYWKIGFKGNGNKPITVNNERRNLSAFYTWMRKRHMVSENPVDGVDPFAETEKPIEFLADWEMEALREACRIAVKRNGVTEIEEYKDQLRDRAILEFLRSTAMRVSECVPVNRNDVDWNTGEVLIYGKKTRTYRKVCLDDMAKYHLKRYLDSRKDENEALFVAIKGKHKRLKKSGIEYIVRRMGERSSLGRKIYPHLFRKTTATNMVRKGCSRDMVAFYLGHKNGNTKTLNKHYAATDPGQVIRAFRQYGAAA